MGTKLFQKACNIQLNYFRMLKEELKFTLLETDISNQVFTTNSNLMNIKGVNNEYQSNYTN